MLDGDAPRGPLVQIGGGSGAGAPTQSIVSAGRADDIVSDPERWQRVRPRFATVYVENRCHLKCEHCYESEQTHPHLQRSERMELADYETLFDELAELGVLYLTLTGGEIFLRGDIFDIVALGRQKRFAVRLYTSGTPIDEARADRIATLKVSEVQVSVYSADAAVHDTFVGEPGAHDKTMRALRLLRQRKVLTVLKTPALTINIDALPQLAALAESVGADFRIDTHLHPRMNGDPRPLRYMVPPDVLRRKLLTHGELYPTFKTVAAETICGGGAGREAESKLCAAGRDVVSIAADGGVLPCASFPLAAGNVKDRSLIEIWRRARLLDDVRTMRFGHMTACGSCAVSSSCDPCMAYALIENGDHRQCNSASLNTATALRSLAEHRMTRERSAAQARHPLRIVGDTCAHAPEKRSPGCGG